MLVEPVQVRPISIMTIAVVKAVAAGKDVKKTSHPKAASMESQIANGWRILKKTALLQWETGKAKIMIGHE